MEDSVVDVTTAPGTVERLPAKVPDDKEFAREYLGEWNPVVNAVLHNEPDPPDLAQRQGARAADRLRAKADRIAQSEVCPVCLRAPKLTAPNGTKACADLKCKAAHGYPRPGAPAGCCGHARIADAPLGHLPSCPNYQPVDPLDVKYDGWTLRGLLSIDSMARRENVVAQCTRSCFTPAQRAAVSAHWSAELRAKVAASAAAALQSERHRITCDPRDPIDLED